MEYESSVLENTSSIPLNPQLYQGGAVSLDELTSELALYEFLAQSKDVSSFFKRIHTLVHRIGFYDYSHLLLNGGDDGREQVGTYPKTNRRLYLGEEFHKYDLMLQHAVLSDEPIFQTQINALVNNSPIKNELFNRNKELYRLMQSFGMNEYYNIPFQSCIGDAKALFSVTAKGVAPADFQRLVERHRPALHALGRAVDQVGSQKFGSHFQRVEHHANMIIHAKPLQLLNVLANRNMTLNDAAETLHISISTANQHIAAAKKALGANTTASAIIQAIKLGLIKLDK